MPRREFLVVEKALPAHRCRFSRGARCGSGPAVPTQHDTSDTTRHDWHGTTLHGTARRRRMRRARCVPSRRPLSHRCSPGEHWGEERWDSQIYSIVALYLINYIIVYLSLPLYYIPATYPPKLVLVLCSCFVQIEFKKLFFELELSSKNYFWIQIEFRKLFFEFEIEFKT